MNNSLVVFHDLEFGSSWITEWVILSYRVGDVILFVFVDSGIASNIIYYSIIYYRIHISVHRFLILYYSFMV